MLQENSLDEDLGAAQELFHIGRCDGVVPLRKHSGSGDLKLSQSCGGGFELQRVVVAIQVGADFEPGGSDGVADEVKDCFVSGERFGGPVSRDLAEQTAFDRIVFGGSGGIVGNGDRESEFIKEPLLDLILPSSARGRVAASGVGQDEQAFGFGVALSTFAFPPLRDEESTILILPYPVHINLDPHCSDCSGEQTCVDRSNLTPYVIDQ